VLTILAIAASLVMPVAPVLPTEACGVHIPANTRVVGPATITQPDSCTTAALIIDGPNVQLIGLRLVGNANGTEFREQAHLVEARDADGLVVQGTTFERINGDGLLLWSGDDVTIEGNTFVGASNGDYRNWLSLIDNHHVRIYGNQFWTPSTRWDMPGGIDIEPDTEANSVTDVTIERNVFVTKVGGESAVQVWPEPWWRKGKRALVTRITTARNILVGPFTGLVGWQR
jgi:hypothetical protein